MAELRQNPATREWILFAPERRQRPGNHGFPGAATACLPEFDPACPFCPGREPECTPGETLRYPAHGEWQVRSFPNRFPAMQAGQADRAGPELARRMHAAGHHEVLCESRRHNASLARMTEPEAELVVRAWHERCRVLRSDPRTDHLSLFKNHGPPAGTSLAHPHSQLVTLPLVPWQVRHRLEEAAHYYDDTGRCVFCDILRSEQESGQRVVARNDHFTAFVPYAAYRPYTVWILPHQHGGCLSFLEPGQLPDLASILRRVLAQLDRALGDPPYNLVFRVGSRSYLQVEFCHWYVGVVPRLAQMSGFELGTGMYINSSLPEEDARLLREAE